MPLDLPRGHAHYYHPVTMLFPPPNSKSCMKPWIGRRIMRAGHCLVVRLPCTLSGGALAAQAKSPKFDSQQLAAFLHLASDVTTIENTHVQRRQLV